MSLKAKCDFKRDTKEITLCDLISPLIMGYLAACWQYISLLDVVHVFTEDAFKVVVRIRDIQFQVGTETHPP